MKKQVKVLTLLALTVSSVNLWAIVDIEAEVNAPVAEMKMMDDAMNKGIKEQRERNARRPMIIEDDKSFHETPMLEFVAQGNEYILEKNVEDMNNTQMKIKLEQRMLTITEIKKIEEVIIEDEVTLGANTTTKRFFESTTSETLQLPIDANAKSLKSHYEKGLFTVTLQKK